MSPHTPITPTPITPTPTYPPTRQGFLDAYRSALIEHWGWNRSCPLRLLRFVGAVHDTLKGASVSGFDWNNPATVTAWLMIGMTGRPTLKALRALPLAAEDVF